jgi:predicted Rossmann-fold nucleotide-binding protein
VTLSYDEVKKPIYLAIVGSRSRNTYEDYEKTYNAYQQFMDRNYKRGVEIVIVSGGASKGGDDFALRIARKHGHQMIIFFPQIPEDIKSSSINTSRYAPYYYERNRKIAMKADAMIACPVFHMDPVKFAKYNKEKAITHGTDYTMDRFKEFHPEGELIKV